MKAVDGAPLVRRLARGRATLFGVALFAFAQTPSFTSPAQAQEEEFKTNVLNAEGSSFAQLAKEVAHLGVDEESLVVVGAIHAPGVDQALNEKLWNALRSRVAAAVPLLKQASERPLSPGEARTKARRARLPLVYLAPRFELGHLQLEVTFTKWPRSFWQRTLAPKGTKTAHLRLKVAADSSIRSLFPRPDKLFSKVETVPSPLAQPLAIACGDVEGDGTREVALFDRRELVVGHIENNQFTVSTRKAWSALSPVSPTPLRAPLGALRIFRGYLDAGLSDRAHLVRLNSKLELVTNAPRAYPLDGGLCSSFSTTGLLESGTCNFEEKPASDFPTPRPSTPDDTTVDSRSDFKGFLPDGAQVSVSASTSNKKQEARATFFVSTEGETSITVPSSGSVVLLSDVDGDGRPEALLSTSKTHSNDSLGLYRYQDKDLKEVARISGGPIHAAAACPFDGKNPLTIVIASGKELKLVQ